MSLTEPDRNLLIGVWTTLEQISNSLTNLLDVMQARERRENETKTSPLFTDHEKGLAAVREIRREEGRCLFCGKPGGELAGRGCYRTSYDVDGETWEPHQWPEKIKTIYDDPDFRRKDGRCLKCGVSDLPERREKGVKCAYSPLGEGHCWPEPEEIPDFDVFPRE